MLKGKASVSGLHPLFRPGPNGMKEQTVVICPARCTPEEKLWIKKIITSAGGEATEMTARKHDQLMSVIQVLTHFHSLVLGNTLAALRVNMPELMKVMSPVYRAQFDIVCRIFAQNPQLYAAIGMKNPETARVTKAFLKASVALRTILTTKDHAAFMHRFKKTVKFLGPHSKRALEESDRLLTSFHKKV